MKLKAKVLGKKNLGFERPSEDLVSAPAVFERELISRNSGQSFTLVSVSGAEMPVAVIIPTETVVAELHDAGIIKEVETDELPDGALITVPSNPNERITFTKE